MGGEVLHDDAHRPAVRRDVVGAEGEEVAVAAGGKQQRANGRAGFEIEGAEGEVAQDGIGIGIAGRVFERRRGLVAEDHHGPAVVGKVAAAEDRVAADHRGIGVFQRGDVQRACELERAEDMVGGAFRIELVEEPHALLRVGQDAGGRAGAGDDLR